MRWFIDLSTRAKMILCFGLMWLMLATIIVVAYGDIAAITRSARELHDVHYSIALALVELRANLNFNRSQILQMMIADSSEQASIEQDIKDRARLIDDTLAAPVKLDFDPRFQSRLGELIPGLFTTRRAIRRFP